MTVAAQARRYRVRVFQNFGRPQTSIRYVDAYDLADAHVASKVFESRTANGDYTVVSGIEPDGPTPSGTVDELKDIIQWAANNGAFVCPLAGHIEKPEMHERHCMACRVRALLSDGWYVAPEDEMRYRLRAHADQWARI